MGEVLRFDGWRVVIYSNDHRPPHVHVLSADASDRFELLRDLGAVRLIDAHGTSGAKLRAIGTELQKHVRKLCKEWSRIHGHF